MSSNSIRPMWKQWVNALLGVGIIAAPFFFGLTDSGVTWTLVIMGVIVLALSLWTTGEVSKEDYERVTHQRQSHA